MSGPTRESIISESIISESQPVTIRPPGSLNSQNVALPRDVTGHRVRSHRIGTDIDQRGKVS